jgi:hypothetical protein
MSRYICFINLKYLIFWNEVSIFQSALILLSRVNLIQLVNSWYIYLSFLFFLLLWILNGFVLLSVFRVLWSHMYDHILNTCNRMLSAPRILRCYSFEVGTHVRGPARVLRACTYTNQAFTMRRRCETAVRSHSVQPFLVTNGVEERPVWPVLLARSAVFFLFILFSILFF